MPGPGLDELDAEFEELAATQEQAEPRMQRARRTVLPEVHITGTPEGTGTVRMAGRGRVELGDEVDANAPIAPVGVTQLPEVAIEAAVPQVDPERTRRLALRDEMSRQGFFAPAWDAILGAVPGTGEAGDRAAERSRERLANWWDQFTLGDARLGGRNPVTPIVGRDVRSEAPAAGFAETATLGFADEARGLGALATGGDYRAARDEARQRMRAAREQAPESFGAGQALGTVPLMAIPGASQASATIGLPARLALATGQGAQLGAMAGFGSSEGDIFESPEQVAQDTAVGGVIGGAFGGLGQAGSEALGAIARGPGLASRAQARDEALLAATGHAGHNRGAVEAFDFGDTHSQIQASRARAAQVLRETGAVPAIAGMRGTARSIEGALGQATSTMDDVRTAMGSRGPTGAEIAERLRERAGGMRAVTQEPTRVVLEDLATRYGDDVLEGARPASEPLDYEALMQEVGGLRQAGAWRTRAGRDVSLREDALRAVDRELRGAYDDAIERQLTSRTGEGGFRGDSLTPEQRQAAERLGMDPVGAYRQARQRYAVLNTALENARRGEAATAGNRLIGFSEQVGGATTGGSVGAALGAGVMGPAGAAVGAPLGAVGGALVQRGLRAVEPRMRASAAEMAYQFARQYPRELMQRLPIQTARTLSEAAARGSAAFATTLHVLAQRDAEVRRLMAEFDQMGEEQGQ